VFARGDVGAAAPVGAVARATDAALLEFVERQGK
jgi:hypothetical protein